MDFICKFPIIFVGYAVMITRRNIVFPQTWLAKNHRPTQLPRETGSRSRSPRRSRPWCVAACSRLRSLVSMSNPGSEKMQLYASKCLFSEEITLKTATVYGIFTANPDFLVSGIITSKKANLLGLTRVFFSGCSEA
jgi:hypothetical protein